MFIPFVVLFITTCISSASHVSLPYHYNGGFFTVNLTRQDSGARFEAQASLELSMTRNFLVSSGPRRYPDEYFDLSSISIGDDAFVVMFDDEDPVSFVTENPRESRGPHLQVSFSPESPIAGQVQNFLIAPSDNDQIGVLHMNPPNPRSFALNGEIYYTENTLHASWEDMFGASSGWGVRAAVGLSTDVTQDFQFSPCMIGSVSPILNVPESIVDQIVREIEGANLRTTRHGDGSIFVHNVNDASFASFPSLHFTIPTTDGQLIHILTIEPHEYFGPTDDSSVRKLLLYPSEELILSREFFRKMVVHFDVQNNRVGFGEPLL